MTTTPDLADRAARMLADRAARALAAIPHAPQPGEVVDQVDGMPLYTRGHAPAHPRSRSQLADERRKPAADAKPAAYVRTAQYRDLVPLYDLADTVPMRPLSARQRAAWITRLIRAKTCLTSESVSANVRERFTRWSTLSPSGGVI